MANKQRYLINCIVRLAEGSQTFYVDAESEDEAMQKYKAGESEIYSSEVEVVSLGEPEIIGTTGLDDTGEF